jgi:hypothetical protein
VNRQDSFEELSSSNEVEEMCHGGKRAIVAVSERDDTGPLKNVIARRERRDDPEARVANANSQEGEVAVHIWPNNVFAGL